jgi:two-component system, OmpR family, phosphate regulon sensor histidine kinase PhoR
MKKKSYRIIIVIAVLALGGLIVVQVNWFARAYGIEARQFDNKINLLLRNVSDQLLKMDNDSKSRVIPVIHATSNSYYVDFDRYIVYSSLDSIIRKTFREHEMLLPFELTVYEDISNIVTFGNLYKEGVLSKAEATCLSRDLPKRTAMDFSITIPDKPKSVIGDLGVWIFSALAFTIVLGLFGVMIVGLSRDKKLAEVKADFINNMTHELQTPISNISIASEVLRKGSANISGEKAVHYADIIYKESQRLRFQVEQVLQTAMMEKGEIEWKKSEVNLNAVIEEVVRIFQVRIQTRHGQIKSKLEALQPLVFGDRLHLANIFYSLLDNADKYSPSTPQITVSTRNAGNGILVAIADNGIGINKDIQQFIFDKFYRGTSGNIHDVKGFGLGLTYVREVMNAHQGKVSVSSEENQGSVFELYFQNC